MNHKFTYKNGCIVLHRIDNQLAKKMNEIVENSSHNDEILALPCNDYGNAQRLMLFCKKYLKYDTQEEKWSLWDGKCWNYNAEMKIQLIAQKVMEKYLDVVTHDSKLDKERKKELIRHATKSNNVGKRANMLKAAENLNYVDGIKCEPYILNTKNCVIDLRTGKQLKHSPKYNCTQIIPFAYNPNAKSKRFKKFIEEICNFDPEYMNYIRTLAGYVATAEAFEEKIWILKGIGQDGKSKFMEILKYVLSDYSAEIPDSAITGYHLSAGQATPELIPLISKRFAFIDELGSDHMINDSVYKKLTGGAYINMRMLHKEFRSIPRTFKIFVGTNYTPHFRNFDKGAKRRTVILPFVNSLKDTNVDDKLFLKLCDDAEYVLKWIVSGAKMYYEHGFGRCRIVEEATAQYCNEEDSVGVFIEMYICRKNGERIMSSVLHKSYELFCNNSGYFPLSNKAFSQALVNRGYKRVTNREGSFFENIAII